MQERDPDVDLMLAFCAGDDAAFDGLFERWAGPLLNFLERMVGDRATAEELVQESFLRVHGARARYAPSARFSTWLYRIGTNLALNELERPRRRHLHLVDDATERAASGNLRQDDAVDSRLAGERVEAALADLPDRQRMALWLRAAEGQTYREIAETLETSEQSVKALVHRGRSALTARLGVFVPTAGRRADGGRDD